MSEESTKLEEINGFRLSAFNGDPSTLKKRLNRVDAKQGILILLFCLGAITFKVTQAFVRNKAFPSETELNKKGITASKWDTSYAYFLTEFFILIGSAAFILLKYLRTKDSTILQRFKSKSFWRTVLLFSVTSFFYAKANVYEQACTDSVSTTYTSILIQIKTCIVASIMFFFDPTNNSKLSLLLNAAITSTASSFLLGRPSTSNQSLEDALGQEHVNELIESRPGINIGQQIKIVDFVMRYMWCGFLYLACAIAAALLFGVVIRKSTLTFEFKLLAYSIPAVFTSAFVSYRHGGSEVYPHFYSVLTAGAKKVDSYFFAYVTCGLLTYLLSFKMVDVTGFTLRVGTDVLIIFINFLFDCLYHHREKWSAACAAQLLTVFFLCFALSRSTENTRLFNKLKGVKSYLTERA